MNIFVNFYEHGWAFTYKKTAEGEPVNSSLACKKSQDEAIFSKGFIWVYIPKNRGGIYPPKWMVKIMEKPMNKWDDLGGFPPIFGNIHILHPSLFSQALQVHQRSAKST